MNSRVMTSCLPTFRVSTIGEAPLTVIVSAMSPMRRSVLTVAVNPVGNSMPSRLIVAKPGSVNVTE